MFASLLRYPPSSLPTCSALCGLGLPLEELVSEGLRLVRDGTAPEDPRAREFVRRWDAVGERLNPDEDTKRAARAMWTDNSTEIAARMPWPAEEITALVAFVERAR